MPLTRNSFGDMAYPGVISHGLAVTEDLQRAVFTQLFILMTALCFLLPAAGLPAEIPETPSRDWSVETASDLGKSLNRAQFLMSSAVRPPTDHSSSPYTASDVGTGLSGFLTVVVGGVNTAMEGQRMGAGAFGLQTLAHGFYHGNDVSTVRVGYGQPLPDFKALGRNTIVTVDMDLDFFKSSQPLSAVTGLPTLQSQTRWAGEMLRQLSTAYKQAYPQESVVALGHSAGSLALARGIERGAVVDRFVMFSPIIGPASLADLAQTHGFRPDQLIAVRGAGDPLNRGLGWDNYSHAFQHLYVKEIFTNGQGKVPGHSGMIPWANAKSGILGVATTKATVGGNLLRNLGISASTQPLAALMTKAIFQPMNTIGSNPIIRQPLNHGNFPKGMSR